MGVNYARMEYNASVVFKLILSNKILVTLYPRLDVWICKTDYN